MCILLLPYSLFLSSCFFFFFSSRRRHTRWTGDWSSDVCSSDLERPRVPGPRAARPGTRGRSRRGLGGGSRSGEGRVGEKGRNRGGADHLKKKKKRKNEEGEGEGKGGRADSGGGEHGAE